MGQLLPTLITGATGFVGRALVEAMLKTGRFEVVGSLRRPAEQPIPGCRYRQVGDLGPDTDWTAALSGVQAVVHLAARVHVMNESLGDPLSEFRRVNVEGTLNLARQAAAAGVRRFVYLSSIKVNGESTEPGKPFSASDAPAPADPYAISKLEAEEGLARVAALTGMQHVVIRPPLVYGPGVKANFESLLRLANRPLPLPLGAVHNRRSLVAVENLADLIITCVMHSAAAGGTFLVSDGADLSTTELLQGMKRALGARGFLFPVPVSLLTTLASMIGQGAVAQRLFGSLQIDLEPTRRTLSWNPPYPVQAALSRVARQFLDAQKR